MIDQTLTRKKPMRARGISKAFKIRRGPRVLLRLLLAGMSAHGNAIQALDGVDIELSFGEAVGVIGKNGSGKSTLLRILGGIHRPDAGIVESDGKTLYLGGFSPSSNPYLTVRQTICLIGSIMDVRGRDIRRLLPEILAFAGLEAFPDMEAFKLSAGMMTRLNVSAIFHCIGHAKPSILLLDEILSVGGDLEFQQKSMQKLSELIGAGAAVLMVSHSLGLIERYSDRVVWLDKGRIRMQGDPAKVVAAYREEYETRPSGPQS